MTAIPSGADALANTLLDSLLEGVDASVPEVNLDDPLLQLPGDTGVAYGTIDRLTTEELTTGLVGGTGLFDKLMSSLAAHLKAEYQAQRISGAEYTKAYIGMTQAALQTAATYLMGRDQAYWSALLVQRQAQAAEVEVIKARVELASTKVTYIKAKFDAFTSEAAYGLTKMKISSEDATYSNLTLQGTLIQEQTEVQHAQTSDFRLNGTTTITGAIGKQKDLYGQQILSYKRDAETKYIKMLVDAWITQKTIDEGLTAPAQFTNSAIDSTMAVLRINLGLD